MKKILALLFLCTLFISCEKSIGGPVPDTEITIFYRDQNKQDLLNPTSTSHISTEDIDIYLLTLKNERRLLYRSNLDMPKMFRIVNEGSDDYRLTLFFEPDADCIDKDNKATMYVSYKNRTEDKFVGQFNRVKFPRSLEKLWVNDKLVWDVNFASHRMISLIK
jgi:hypothetical protein